jgi:hypothetical protein
MQKIRNKSDSSKNEFMSPTPDWMESREIIKSSSYPGSSLVIIENNIGMVTVDVNGGKVVHKLLFVKRTRPKSTKE